MHIRSIIALLTIALGHRVLAAAPIVSALADGSVGTNVPATTAATGNVVQVHSGSGPHGVVFSSANSSDGFLKAHAEATTTAENANSYFSTGTAFFQDNFSIDSAGREGQIGYLTVVFVVSATVMAQADAPESNGGGGISYAQVVYDLYAGNLSVPDISKQQQLFSDGSTTSPAIINQEQALTVPFTFGAPFDVKLVLTATGRAFTTHAGLYRTDAAIRWIGIRSVTDTPNGPAVPFYTLSTASGTNYFQPIPLPSISRISALSGRHILIQGEGIPLRSNSFLVSDQPTTGFVLLQATTAAADGSVQLDDASAAAVTRRFYRLSHTIAPP